MSLLKTIKAQLGLSFNQANNFVLDASADNGTMKLARNNGQDIMTVGADGKVAFPQNGPTLLTKVINSTTPPTLTPVGQAHGLNGAKIRSVSLSINYQTGEYLPEGYIGTLASPFGQYLIDAYWTDTQLVMVPYANAIAAVLNKPCVITIQYEA